jgi:hypothetical protein
MIANEVDLAEYEALELTSEHDHQVQLFQWAADHTTILRPELALLFAIPNGGKRDPKTAFRMQEEGVKSGVPDMFLPVARQGYHGLFIELKYGKNTTTERQDGWIERLTAQGYLAVVCYGWEAASRVLGEYLGIETPR